MSGLRTVLLGIALASGSVCYAQTSAAQPAPLTLSELEAMALENNPTLKQAAAEIEAARGRALQAGLFPNPVVGYTGDEISAGPIIRGGEHGFFVEQTIPISGKLRLSRAVFQQEIAQAEALAEAQRFRVLNTVRVLFHQAVVAAHRVEVRERLAQVTREAVGVSAQLFNVGAADRPDVLESEIEERRTQVDLTAARNMQIRVWRRLAAAVGDPKLAPRLLAGRIDAALPELERQQLLETLLRESPEVKAARAAVERAEATLRRARREPVPDLVVRAGPRYNRELLEVGSRPVGWEGAVEVGITLPLFNRNQGNVRAAQAEVSRARAELRRLELTLGARLADVFDEYLTSLRTAEVFRSEIIPRADQVYQLYLSRYREMAAAYPQVLVAQRTLVQVNEDYLAKLDAAWRTAVQLQGFLLGDGLQAAGRPGETTSEMPGVSVDAMRGGGIQR